MTYTMHSSPVISLSQIAAARMVLVEQVCTESNVYDQNVLNQKEDDTEEYYGNDILEEQDKEFEFPLISRNSDSSPASADDIFCNGKILPMYSVSGNYSQFNGGGDAVVVKSIQKTSPPAVAESAVRLSLRLLFLEDREHPPPSSSSCSSSESEELDGVTPGTYCVWEPKSTAECKKSNSTGSSKRLKFRNFMNRSSSEGARDRIVFPTPTTDEPKRDEKFDKSPEMSGKVTAAAVDLFAKGGGEKRRQSPLPYRQDMVGFFGNANGTKKWNLHPF